MRQPVKSLAPGKPRRTPWKVYVEVTQGRVRSSGRRLRGRDHSRQIKRKLRAGRAR